MIIESVRPNVIEDTKMTLQRMKALPGEIQEAIDAAYAKHRALKEGKNADYIPALANVDPNLFGIALVTADGKVYTAGDAKTEVSIQSISKVFTMAQVMRAQRAIADISNALGGNPYAAYAGIP